MDMARTQTEPTKTVTEDGMIVPIQTEEIQIHRNSLSGAIHSLPVKRISATYHWPADVPVAEIRRDEHGYLITNLATGKVTLHEKQAEAFAVLKYIHDTR